MWRALTSPFLLWPAKTSVIPKSAAFSCLISEEKKKQRQKGKGQKSKAPMRENFNLICLYSITVHGWCDLQENKTFANNTSCWFSKQVLCGNFIHFTSFFEKGWVTKLWQNKVWHFCQSIYSPIQCSIFNIWKTNCMHDLLLFVWLHGTNFTLKTRWKLFFCEKGIVEMKWSFHCKLE